MAKNDIDPELMGRVAERMEESGRALKTIQSQLNDHGARVSAAEAKLDSAHARIKKLEDVVNGNGSKGLKTDIELAKSGLKNLEEDIKELKAANGSFVTETAHSRELLAMRERTDQQILTIKEHFDTCFKFLTDKMDERRKGG